MAQQRSYQKVIIFILCLGGAIPVGQRRASIDYCSTKYARACRTPKALWGTSKTVKAQTDCGAVIPKMGQLRRLRRAASTLGYGTPR